MANRNILLGIYTALHTHPPFSASKQEVFVKENIPFVIIKSDKIVIIAIFSLNERARFREREREKESRFDGKVNKKRSLFEHTHMFSTHLMDPLTRTYIPPYENIHFLRSWNFAVFAFMYLLTAWKLQKTKTKMFLLSAYVRRSTCMTLLNVACFFRGIMTERKKAGEEEEE